METNHVLLKSSVFGGFKKKDVLSYIFELNEATQDEKQKLAEQIGELLQSRDALSVRVDETEREISRLKGELSDANARLEQESIKNEQLSLHAEKVKSEVLRYESTVSQQNAEIARQTELNSVLAEKNRSYEEKRRQVELAASQISALLGQAHADAEDIVARAKQEAEGIVKNALSSIEAHVEEANRATNEAYKRFAGFSSELASLHEAVLKATASVNDRMQSIRDAVTGIEVQIPEKLTAENLPKLKYKKEERQITAANENAADTASVTTAAISLPSIEEEAANMTMDILRRYGVRKDDSGFFRLAADK